MPMLMSQTDIFMKSNAWIRKLPGHLLEVGACVVERLRVGVEDGEDGGLLDGDVHVFKVIRGAEEW